RKVLRPRRFVVCGDNPLAYRLVRELVDRFGADVTVVLPNRNRNQGPNIGQLLGVSLVEAANVDDAALRAAGVVDARALALVGQDDVGNTHAALRAHELNPDLRLVIRMFNMSLGFRIRTLFADCAVLSDAAMAAPHFVAAALGGSRRATSGCPAARCTWHTGRTCRPNGWSAAWPTRPAAPPGYCPPTTSGSTWCWPWPPVRRRIRWPDPGATGPAAGCGRCSATTWCASY
ncbi:MAG TPA: NAD-binding protein, partial [Pseudonocardiaceae bacterium]